MAKDIKIAKIVKKLQDEGNFDKENFDKASMEEPTDDFDQALEAPLSDNEFAEPSESLKAAGIESVTPVESEWASFIPPEASEPGQGNPLSVKNVRALRGLPPLEEEQAPQLPVEPQVQQAPTQVQPQPKTAPVAQPVQAQPITPEQQEEQDMFVQEQALLEEKEKAAKKQMISKENDRSKREQKYKNEINVARKNIKGANVFQSGTVFQKILAGLSLFAGALGGAGAETMAIFKANEKAIIDRNQDLINKYTAQLGDATKAKIAIRQDYYDTVDKIIDQKIQMASPAMKLNLEKLKLEIADKNARIDQYIRQKTSGIMSKGQEAMDKAFGQEYAKFLSGGKLAGNVKNLAAVRRAMKGLKESDAITGPIISLVPDWIRKRTPGLRKGIQVQQLVESVVQQSLKETLGGQFTEREGEKLVQRAFDPTQPEEENIKRVQILLNSIENMMEAKTKAAKWFREKGTLAGYPGDLDFKGMIIKEGDITPVGFEKD